MASTADTGHSEAIRPRSRPPTREQILAGSAGWVAVVLNLVPGVENGNLYPWRWKAESITVAVAVILPTPNRVLEHRLFHFRLRCSGWCPCGGDPRRRKRCRPL